jgi:hypothetical protein
LKQLPGANQHLFRGQRWDGNNENAVTNKEKKRKNIKQFKK